MVNIKETYQKFCESKGLTYRLEKSIKSYDDTTLFCNSGMQQFKDKFKDSSYKNTICNIQPCLRLNDLDLIDDGSHFLYFNMIGYFSFREKTVKEVIDFWVEFIQNELKLKIDYVTTHPDKKEWEDYYKEYDFETKLDEECIWSDNGDLSGYCTEFFIGDLEIGNIVNPLGNCIDVGFGLERLDYLVNGTEKNSNDVLIDTYHKMVESDIFPSNKLQGYVMRKIIRMMIRKDILLDDNIFLEEKEKYDKMVKRYHRIKDFPRNQGKSSEWWFSTHGIDIDLIYKENNINLCQKSNLKKPT